MSVSQWFGAAHEQFSDRRAMPRGDITSYSLLLGGRPQDNVKEGDMTKTDSSYKMCMCKRPAVCVWREKVVCQIYLRSRVCPV